MQGINGGYGTHGGSARTQRLPYHAPHIEQLGSVADITAGLGVEGVLTYGGPGPWTPPTSF